jgi:hypothetical protein
LVRLAGIEPAHPAPEAGALSTELQAHKYNFIMYIMKLYKKTKRDAIDKPGEKRKKRKPGGLSLIRMFVAVVVYLYSILFLWITLSFLTATETQRCYNH